MRSVLLLAFAFCSFAHAGEVISSSISYSTPIATADDQAQKESNIAANAKAQGDVVANLRSKCPGVDLLEVKLKGAPWTQGQNPARVYLVVEANGYCD